MGPKQASQPASLSKQASKQASKQKRAIGDGSSMFKGQQGAARCVCVCVCRGVCVCVCVCEVKVCLLPPELGYWPAFVATSCYY